ncbi:hypothetical protein Tco_0178595 [Tanacetum coccineum]
MKNRAVELCDNEGNEFIVNRQRVKLYWSDVTNSIAEEDVILEDVGGVTNFLQEITNGIFVQKFFQENEATIFTAAGDDVRIFPDDVIFDKESSDVLWIFAWTILG